MNDYPITLAELCRMAIAHGYCIRIEPYSGRDGQRAAVVSISTEPDHKNRYKHIAHMFNSEQLDYSRTDAASLTFFDLLERLTDNG